MKELFKALVVNKQEEQVTVEIKQLKRTDLPKGEVLIRVHYSSVNYKDSLATIANGNIVSTYPFVPGIDLAGTVVSSDDDRFQEGDEVIATSYEMGLPILAVTVNMHASRLNGLFVFQKALH